LKFIILGSFRSIQTESDDSELLIDDWVVGVAVERNWRLRSSTVQLHHKDVILYRGWVKQWVYYAGNNISLHPSTLATAGKVVSLNTNSRSQND
jgi:hypothetical protein